MSKKVNLSKIKFQENSSSTVYVTWSSNIDHVDHYTVQWQYQVSTKSGYKTFFKESKSSVNIKQSTFSLPDNAITVKVGVKPVAKQKKYKKNGKQHTKPYFSGAWAYSTLKNIPTIYNIPKRDPVNSNVLNFSIESGTGSSILVFWNALPSGKGQYENIDHITAEWAYSPDNGATWLNYTEVDNIRPDVNNFTFSPPSNATHVKARILPVARTKLQYGRDIPEWQSSWYPDYQSYDVVTHVKELVGGKRAVDSSTITIRPYTNSGRSVMAEWSWSDVDEHLDHYQAKWEYRTGDLDTDPWIPGTEESCEEAYSIYSVPQDAVLVRVKVQPIAEDTTGGYPYWEAPWSDYASSVIQFIPPDTPSTPSVSIDGTKLTAEIRGYDWTLTLAAIEFAIFQKTQTGRSQIAVVAAPLEYGIATISYTVGIGNGYEVRCRAFTGMAYSDWSALSDTVYSSPATPTGFTVIRAESATTVELEWEAIPTADDYDIEYTTKKYYFDGGDVQSVSSEGLTRKIVSIQGDEGGSIYWFRLRAKRDSLVSGWSEPQSVAVGTKPDPPTTWTLTSTVIVGTQLTFYWAHNAQDGSEQSAAVIQLTINGDDHHEIPIPGTTNEYTYDTTSLADGATILWRVQTKGVIDEYSDWSVQRKVMVYAPATLTMADPHDSSAFWQNLNEAEQEAYADYIGQNVGIPEEFTHFPLFVAAYAGPQNQNAIRYFVSIVSNESYETTDFDGQERLISEGDEIYTTYVDAIGNHLLLVLKPSDINIDNDINYTVKVTVSMDTGLTAEASADFHVDWQDNQLDPNAEIDYDEDLLVCYITPYCSGYVIRPIQDNLSDDLLDNNSDVLYSFGYEDRVGDAVLSVYRREFDGTFTEIMTGINSSDNVTVVDPHPALDLARYRIVAVSQNSGEIYYTDLPGEPIGETSVIIQWEEAWQTFDATEDTEFEESEPSYAGSMLKLPYDIDVSNNYQQDVTLAEYIGRRHPVSYYGTQKGETATWNIDIWADDADTLYGLRRLAIYAGDVYVREPSGSGYWANVNVSFSQKHLDLKIPVTLTITRVEGGM